MPPILVFGAKLSGGGSHAAGLSGVGARPASFTPRTILTKKPDIEAWALSAGTQDGHQHPRCELQIHFNCSRENELCQAFVLSAAGKRQLSLATTGGVDAVLPNGDLDGIIIITLRREMTIMPRETFDEQIGELQEDILALGLSLIHI